MSSGNDDKLPKLYTTKPKKSRLKQQQKAKDFSTPTPSPSPSSSSTATTSVSPNVVKEGSESFARRYRFVWPVLLTVNLAIGGYLYLRTSKKDKSSQDREVVADVPSTQASSATASTPVGPIIPPVKVRAPIPEDQQRELFKWILEEKRKFKSNNPEENKRIDEDKAVLEKFILGKSIPSL